MRNKALSRSAPRTFDERKPRPVDIHIGKRIRMRRSLMGVSQEKLAEALGVSFQQVQKYERGANRVSASRLYQIGKTLDVPVAYFYQEFTDKPVKQGPRPGLSDNEQEDILSEDILYEKETIELIRLYYSLEDERKRRDLLKIMRSMVESMKSSG